jgi:DNA-directed RNA polymerase subunit RPC12/RpoP
MTEQTGGSLTRMGDNGYVCASCFGEFDSLQWCGWCNEPNTGDMEGSYAFGCNHCGGKASWDND